jgi:hypothetical protein
LLLVIFEIIVIEKNKVGKTNEIIANNTTKDIIETKKNRIKINTQPFFKKINCS